MGIWDKSEALGHPQLTDTFEEGRAFALMGMDLTAPVDLGTELGPTPVALLTVRGASEKTEGDGNWSTYGTEQVVSIISQPVIEMAQNAKDHPADDDFPVVVKWITVQPKDKSRNAARVLQLVARTVTVK